ncbi:MAG: hypothetical protein ABI120_04005 [Gemmatimonadaceae bacterium]
MEFVIVTYPSERVVNVDGGPLGKTGQKLKMAAGTHDFDLDAPLDYMPGSQTVQVARTTSASPLTIAFAPILVLVATDEAPMLMPPMSMRRRGSKRTKFASKEAVKRALKNVARKTLKEAVSKTAKKAVKTTAKKVAKKSARKPLKRTAKQTMKRPTKKVAKKSATRRKAVGKKRL